LKQQVAIKTFSDWTDAEPGFVEVDLVAHCGWTGAGPFLYTLTLVDVASGWVSCAGLRDKRALTVLAALRRLQHDLPFKIRGLDSDCGSEFLNTTLIEYCANQHITFTRGRPYRKNDGCHVEQKNWTVVRTLVGYYRYDTASELLLLNEIWQLQSKLTNYFYPQQKLISKVRTGAKVARKHDKATTPFHRAVDHPSMTMDRIVALKRTYSLINPAATQRQIQALTIQLFTLATSKATHGTPTPVTKRARSREATTPPTRAS
jgi:hypothetical protein